MTPINNFIMYVRPKMFEFMIVPLENVAIELNRLYAYCYEVKVLNSIISENKITLVLELILKGPNSERDYKRDYKKN